MGKTGSDAPNAMQPRNRPIWQIVLKAIVGQCTSWRDHRVNFVLMLGSSPQLSPGQDKPAICQAHGSRFIVMSILINTKDIQCVAFMQRLYIKLILLKFNLQVITNLEW